MPGMMLLVTAVSGTSFRFSAAVRSSCVSSLPHSGQWPEKTLNFRDVFFFMGCEAAWRSDGPRHRARLKNLQNQALTLNMKLVPV